MDVGGTFTDFLLWEDGRLAVYKRPSAPEDPSLAVPAGLDGIVGPQELPDGGDDGDLPLRAHVLPRFGQNTP